MMWQGSKARPKSQSWTLPTDTELNWLRLSMNSLVKHLIKKGFMFLVCTSHRHLQSVKVFGVDPCWYAEPVMGKLMDHPRFLMVWMKTIKENYDFSLRDTLTNLDRYIELFKKSAWTVSSYIDMTCLPDILTCPSDILPEHNYAKMSLNDLNMFPRHLNMARKHLAWKECQTVSQIAMSRVYSEGNRS